MCAVLKVETPKEIDSWMCQIYHFMRLTYTTDRVIYFDYTFPVIQLVYVGIFITDLQRII